MEKRVDIKLEEEVLRWAAIEAAKMGISRRQYLAKGLTTLLLMVRAGTLDLDPFRKECPEYKYELYNFNKSNKPYEVEEI